MIQRTCGREPEILRTARTAWRRDLREHAAGCVSCQEALWLAEQLGGPAQDADEAPLPEPGRIYWRAQLLQRRTLADRATRSIRMVQQISVAAALVVIAAVTVAAWPAVEGAARLIVSGGSSGPRVLPGMVVLLTLLAVTIVLCWWTANAEDA
jgi:hypothetical protein